MSLSYIIARVFCYAQYSGVSVFSLENYGRHSRDLSSSLDKLYEKKHKIFEFETRGPRRLALVSIFLYHQKLRSSKEPSGSLN